jgi:hypothetical protein
MPGTMDGLKAALETTKQIITLATGVIALTITFLEKIVQVVPGSSRDVPFAIKGAWIAFGFSIVFAIWTLMAITGSMNALDRKAHGLTLNRAQEIAVDELCEGTNVRIPSFLMVFAFAVGISLTIVTGFYL